MVERAKSNRNNGTSIIEDLELSLLKLVDGSTSAGSTGKTNSVRILHSTPKDHKEMETTMTFNVNERLTLTQAEEPVAYRLVRKNDIPNDMHSTSAITTDRILIDPLTDDRYYKVSDEYCVNVEGEWFMMELVANNVQMVTECETPVDDSIISFKKIRRRDSTSTSSVCERKHYTMDVDLELLSRSSDSDSESEILICINSTRVHEPETTAAVQSKVSTPAITVTNNSNTTAKRAANDDHVVKITTVSMTRENADSALPSPKPRCDDAASLFSTENILNKFVKSRMKDTSLNIQPLVKDARTGKSTNKTAPKPSTPRTYMVTNVVRMSEKEASATAIPQQETKLGPQTPLYPYGVSVRQRQPLETRQHPHVDDRYYYDRYPQHEYRRSEYEYRQPYYPSDSTPMTEESYDRYPAYPVYRPHGTSSQTPYVNMSPGVADSGERYRRDTITQDSYSLSSQSSWSAKTISAPSISTINNRCIKNTRTTRIGRGCCSGRIYSNDIPLEAWNQIELGEIEHENFSGYVAVQPKSAKLAIQQANST